MISKRIFTCLTCLFILGLISINYAQAANSRCQSPDECSSDEPTGQDPLFASDEYQHLEFYPPPIWGVWATIGGGYGTAFQYSGPAGHVGFNVRYQHSLITLEYTTVQESTDITASTLFGTSDPSDGGFVKNYSLMYNWVIDRKWGFYSFGAGISEARGRERDKEIKETETIRVPVTPPDNGDNTNTTDGGTNVIINNNNNNNNNNANGNGGNGNGNNTPQTTTETITVVKERIVRPIEDAFGIPLQAQVMWLPFGNYLGIGLKVFANVNFKSQFSDIGGLLVIAIGKFR